MLTDHLAVTERQEGAGYFLNPEGFQSNGRPHNVNDGVDGPDLMECHLVRWDSMDSAFCFGQDCEDGEGTGLDAIAQRRSLDQATNIRPVVMCVDVRVLVLMLMCVEVLVLIVMCVLVLMVMRVLVLMVMRVLVLMVMCVFVLILMGVVAVLMLMVGMPMPM